MRRALGLSVLRFWLFFFFLSVFRFLGQKGSVFRFWCSERFADYMCFCIRFSVFTKTLRRFSVFPFGPLQRWKCSGFVRFACSFRFCCLFSSVFRFWRFFSPVLRFPRGPMQCPPLLYIDNIYGRCIPSCGFLLCGDLKRLNIRHLTTQFKLKHLVDKPIRKDQILDLVITNLPQLYDANSVQTLPPFGLSDHKVVLVGPKARPQGEASWKGFRLEICCKAGYSCK